MRPTVSVELKLSRLLAVLAAVAAGVGCYVGVALATVWLYPTGEYSIPYGWVLYLFRRNLPYFASYLAIGMALARYTYPRHKLCAWIAGCAVPAVILLLFGIPHWSPEPADTFYKVRLYTTSYLPMVLALPAFILGSIAVNKLRGRPEPPP